MNQPGPLPYMDAVLLLAFGGPTSPEEIRPFLRDVMAGRPFPEAELEEIAHHYEAIGGKSPMNELTLGQGKVLEAFFREKHLSIPVYVGFRHAPPNLRETLEKMVSGGIQRARALILAPHQSEASWDRYHRALQKASHALGEKAPKIDFVQPFFDEPLFIDAVADQVRRDLPQETFTLLVTAHSLPLKMAENSPYVEQVTISARLVAEKLDALRWKVAYQSRSGDQGTPWLSPDICDAIRTLAKAGETCVVVVPVGFVCEHVETLYDLDIEAKSAAKEAGLRFIRAKTPGHHPKFVQMMAERLLQEPVQERVS